MRLCCTMTNKINLFTKNRDYFKIIVGSIPSLAAGVLFGGALAYGAFQASREPASYTVQLVSSSILAGVMGYRYYNSRKIMPAGVICAISGAMILRIAFNVVTGVGSATPVDRKIT